MKVPMMFILALALAGCSARPRSLREWEDLGLTAKDVRAVRHYAEFKEIR